MEAGKTSHAPTLPDTSVCPVTGKGHCRSVLNSFWSSDRSPRGAFRTCPSYQRAQLRPPAIPVMSNCGGVQSLHLAIKVFSFSRASCWEVSSSPEVLLPQLRWQVWALNERRRGSHQGPRSPVRGCASCPTAGTENVRTCSCTMPGIKQVLSNQMPVRRLTDIQDLGLCCVDSLLLVQGQVAPSSYCVLSLSVIATSWHDAINIVEPSHVSRE